MKTHGSTRITRLGIELVSWEFISWLKSC